jgi:hypothetical protein
MAVVGWPVRRSVVLTITGWAVTGTLWMIHFRVVGTPREMLGHWSCPSMGSSDRATASAAPAKPARVGNQSVVLRARHITTTVVPVSPLRK